MPTFTYGDLIAWSEGQHTSGKARLRPWQRDALRRILKQGSLPSSDIDDLVGLAKDAQNSPPGLTPVVATLAHVTPSGKSLTSVALTCIADIARVNALAEGPIPFDALGLTVVFGENASGKSGITRILKQACRARVPGGRIRPNVFKPEPGEPAKATIHFEVDGTADHHKWVDGANAGDVLATVTVFDSSCAAHQVQRDEVLTYTPELLAVFREFAIVCDSVQTELEIERAALGGTPAAITALQGELGTATKAGEFLHCLSAKSDLKELDKLSTLSTVETKRLTELRDALREDPLKAASEIEARSRRVAELESTLATARTLVTDDAIDALASKSGEAASSAKAANDAREAFAQNSDLDGIGSDSWKRLWDAAREYSNNEAYPSETFPVTRGGAACVLCQQPLVEDTPSRLQSFEKFVTAEVQKTADKAASELAVDVNSLRNTDIPRSSKAAILDAGLLDAGEAPELRALVVSLKRRRRDALRLSAGKAVGPRALLPELPALGHLRDRLSTEVDNLKAAAVADERAEMEQERNELEARVKLAPHRATIESEIARLQERDKLNILVAECNTTGITRKQGEAERLIVTGRFKSKFRQNLNDIGFSETPVDIEAGRGAQGKRPYGVRLTANPDVPAYEVLSEGEATCVALAGVLSELDITENRSALVLDDPVSSLDHNYRERVAKRLCEEAKVRQVIVFTHDVVFLFVLDKYARSFTIPHRQVSLLRGGSEGGHGHVEDEPPWITMKVTDRIKRLRRELGPARKVLKDGDRAGYEREARRIYEALRQTWERAVEDVLLNGAVLRFGDGVHTKPLRKVADDLRLEDIERIDAEMAYCSGFVHDRARSTPARPPDPDIVESDIKKLADWAKTVQERRKSRVG